MKKLFDLLYFLIKEALPKLKYSKLLAEAEELMYYQGLTVKVFIIGAFSAGKSQLINAFIGSNVLPQNIKPESSCVVRLRYTTESPYLRIFYMDASGKVQKKIVEIKSFPIEELSAYNISNCLYIDIHLPNEKLEGLNNQYLTLCDTPGLNSGNWQHEQALSEMMRLQADVIIVALDVSKGSLDKRTTDYIEDLLKRKPGICIGALITKADKVKNPADVINYVGGQLKALVPESQYMGIQTTSAKNSQTDGLQILLDGIDIDGYAYSSFKEKIVPFAKDVQERTKWRMDNSSKDMEAVILQIDSHLKEIELAEELYSKKKITIHERIDGTVVPIVTHITGKLTENYLAVVKNNHDRIAQIYKDALLEGTTIYLKPILEEYQELVSEVLPGSISLSVPYSEIQSTDLKIGLTLAGGYLALMATIVALDPEPVTKLVAAIITAIAAFIKFINDFFQAEATKEAKRKAEASEYLNGPELQELITEKVTKYTGLLKAKLDEAILNSLSKRREQLESDKQYLNKTKEQKEAEIKLWGEMIDRLQTLINDVTPPSS